MASYTDATHAITTGQGQVIDLGQGYTGIDVLAEAECAVQIVTSDQAAPVAPGGNPLPGSGSNAVVVGWRHLRPGDSYVKGFDPPPNSPLGTSGANDPSERIRWLRVWGIGTGYLQIGTTRR